MDKKKPAVDRLTAAIYCRYSSEQQRNSFSIEAQTRACKDYAHRQGWKVHRIYIDEARSGTSDRREEFQRMISDALSPSKPFGAVLVYKTDRFARSREDAIKYKALLKRQGIRFVSATEPIGSGDVTEVLLESMLDGMAEFYSLQLSQRTLAGMIESVKQGYAVGKAPFGYRHRIIQTPKGPKRKLEVDHSKAGIVRQVFALYLKGHGVQTIREKLTGRAVMTKNFILWMLRNEKYAGDTAYGTNPHKSAKTAIEPILVKDTHPAIIERKDWQRVQDLLASKSPRDGGVRFVKSDYLLSGLLKCKCGAQMVGHSATGHGGKYLYYSCGAVIRYGKKACPMPAVNATRLEAVIFHWIKRHLTEKSNVLSIIEAHNEALGRLQANKGREMAHLRAEAGRKDLGARNLMQAVETGQGLHLGHIAGRLDEIQKEKDDIERRIAELEAVHDLKPITEADGDRMFEYLKALFESGLLKNKTLFHGLVQSIELLGDDKAKITYNPNFNPTADWPSLKGTSDKKVRMSENWLPGWDSMRTSLGAYIVDLRWPKRSPRQQTVGLSCIDTIHRSLGIVGSDISLSD